MRLCRFNNDRLGVVDGDTLIDITNSVEALPALSWPPEPGDHIIRNLPQVLALAKSANRDAAIPVSSVHLNSPIASPGKVIAAPLNYAKHVTEVGQDPGIHHNTNNTSFDGFPTPIAKLGLFLKAGSSVCGPSDGFQIRFPERRNDHEVELAVVIGQKAKEIPVEAAMDYIAGYCIGLDMTVRGPEDRSFRKSPDSYTVLGPCFVTADEVPRPENLSFWIKVNGDVRQQSTTASLIVSIPELISLASHWYTLYPGDVILTGTPDGVGPVEPGDTMEAWIDGVGSMTVSVS